MCSQSKVHFEEFSEPTDNFLDLFLSNVVVSYQSDCSISGLW